MPHSRSSHSSIRAPADHVGHAGHTFAQDDDGILVRRSQSDQEAFAAIYDRYFSRVYWYCYGRLRSEQAAEDATSIVFTKVLGALPRFRDQESGLAFRAWLFRIAHNVIIDELRARRIYEPLAAAHEIPDPMLSPESEVLQAEDRNLVWGLLDVLPPEQRQIVELRLAGLNGPEIALVLGKNRGAVNTAQSRAVARLRTAMGITQSAPGEEGRDVTS